MKIDETLDGICLVMENSLDISNVLDALLLLNKSFLVHQPIPSEIIAELSDEEFK